MFIRVDKESLVTVKGSLKNPKDQIDFLSITLVENGVFKKIRYFDAVDTGDENRGVIHGNSGFEWKVKLRPGMYKASLFGATDGYLTQFNSDDFKVTYQVE
ncbi:MAG: hypothetical protein MJ245_06190 [Clostridia bacterium]|nr:hypothetical protein [Clostridia bacterium]